MDRSVHSSVLDTKGGHRLRDFIALARPRQWMKNAVVLAAFFFALGDKQQNISFSLFADALLAAALFSIVAGGVYAFNDIADRERDRLHRVKKNRPVASGRVSVPAAGLMAALCLCCGLAGAWLFSTPFAAAVSLYVLIQAAYTLKLKHIPLLDVFVIAAGFVIRAIAGGLAVQVEISSWLLICAFLIALFLALCKRRHEKRLVVEGRLEAVRPSIESGDIRLFDQLIAVTAGATIIAYAVYTQWPDTVFKFGSANLLFSVPFVVFGLFRYLDLVYRGERCDQPEYILLTDLPLLIDILLFGAVVLWAAIR